MTVIANEVPTNYNPVADLERFNVLLDAITIKRYLSPTVFAQAVRGACDLAGIAFPLLPFEMGDGVPTSVDGQYIQSGLVDPTTNAGTANGVMTATHIDDGEWIYNIEDKDGNIENVYLYLVIDRDDEGLYECYAQIVNDDELHDLLNMDEKDFPELVGDVSGETEYLKQTRHATFTGAHADDGAPLE